MLSRIFGNNIKTALRQGAIVIDVRSPNEFDRGRVPDSINIPLDRLSTQAARIVQMRRPVIFCSGSGRSSRTALRMMRAKGLRNALDGGSWERVLRIQESL
ncbi:MAG TPA: rhodanese-like domain-containing protein [Chitinophagaceae bacterium]|nr:rhodanese-like domain-containing protein [Chitinophagaceae bacterium]